jgi:hypothetical protein
MESLCSSESLATFYKLLNVISEKSAPLVTLFVEIFYFQKVFAFTGSFIHGTKFSYRCKLHYAKQGTDTIEIMRVRRRGNLPESSVRH